MQELDCSILQSVTDPKISEVLDFSDNTQEGSNISDLRTDPVYVSLLDCLPI